MSTHNWKKPEVITTLTENGDETALYTSEDTTETRVMTPFDTTSIKPVKSDLTDAQADVGNNSASYIQLSTGELLKSGRVYYPAHGLTVGGEYYLDQSTAGGFTDVKPTAGEVQALFSPIDADRIEIQIQENYNTDVASFVSYIATDTARQALASPKPDTIYTVLDSLDDGSNVTKSYTYDIVNGVWVAMETEKTLSITDTIAGNKIATIDLEQDGIIPVDINETITGLARVGNTLTYTKEDGTNDELDELIPFTISAIDENSGVVGTQGLTFTAESFNVVYPAITWSIDSFSGDITNVSIDASTGEVTYDVTSSLTNNGRGLIVIRAVDAIGQIQVTATQIKSADPSSETTLACNGDIAVNSPDLVSKLILFAKADAGSMYQDLAKTIPAVATGDPVSVLEDATGSGDITVKTGNNPPSLSLSDPTFNNNNVIEFDANNNESLQYDVPSPPAVGDPFKFFAFFSFDLASVSDNGTLIASTSQANNDTTGGNSWQLSHGGGDGNFVFRIPGTWSNALVQTGANAGIDINISLLNEVANSQPHLIYVNYQGAANNNRVQVYLDGTLRLDAESSIPLGGEHFKLFENRGGSDFIDGELAEMLYADASMTDAEAIETQGYFLCKYGLDASLLAYASPFSVLSEFYDTTSQFVYQVLSDGTETVYDIVNNVYYEPTNVPTPGLGYFLDPALKVLRENTPTVDDQSLNGYMDIEGMRIAWGVTPGGSGIETVIFPAGGFGSTPTITFNAVGTFVRETAINSISATQAVIEDGGSQSKHWQAIGIKP